VTALAALANDLDRLEAAGRRRALVGRSGIDFASNDYLGLAASARLARAVADAAARGVPVGSGGSRLLRGQCAEHEALEADAARFFGAESALFVGSGYSANAMLFAALPQRGDLVVHDALVHASAHEGMRLGRAECRPFAHNDAGAAADVIAAWRAEGGRGTPWIAVESLYSMDGDRAPLADLAALAQATGAMLMVDEAHATGVYGPDGRGLAHALDGRADAVILRTCGKAMGCEGALVLAPAVVRDFLVNRGRGFIFSTAPSPLMAAAARESLRTLADEPWRRDQLAALVARVGAALARLGLPASGSPIQPVVLGDERRTMAAAAALRARGFDVRGVRPPSVPAGTSRLRLSLTLNASVDDVAALANALGEVL